MASCANSGCACVDRLRVVHDNYFVDSNPVTNKINKSDQMKEERGKEIIALPFFLNVNLIDYADPMVRTERPLSEFRNK